MSSFFQKRIMVIEFTQFFSDQAINAFRIIRFVHDVAGRFFRLVTSYQQQQRRSCLVSCIWLFEEMNPTITLCVKIIRDIATKKISINFIGSTPNQIGEQW